MKQTQLFTKTRKEAPAGEEALNAKLLIRAGYVHKEMAGVYDLLPLGQRVYDNVTQIIREELNSIGALELTMSGLQKSEVWEPSGRWARDLDDGIWFRTQLNNGTELGLAFSHEEPLSNIMKNYISSYKDLPIYTYQFQNKFRNELRSKAGLMRGREFVMKDLYDFSSSMEEHLAFYEKMKGVYKRIFDRLGIGEFTYLTISNGGTFSKYSYEFQTLCDAGEDILVFDEKTGLAINKDDFSDEVLKDFNINKSDYNFVEKKSAEVGDIYTLNTKFSDAAGLSYTDKEGKVQKVYMGSYGIGIQRVMGTLVEVFADEAGIVWPEEVAPFRIHIIDLNEEEKSIGLYDEFVKMGKEVLLDDRDTRAGEKFADSDLLGIPHRITVSKKSIEAGGVEYKARNSDESTIYSYEDILAKFS